MLNIYLIGKNRSVIKIHSLVLKNRYFDVSIKISTSFDEIKPTDGIYVIFSSVEKEFSEWIDNLNDKKVFLISFGENEMLNYPIMYNEIISKNSAGILQQAIEKGIRYLR